MQEPTSISVRENLKIDVVAYQYPDLHDELDGNWLVGTVVLRDVTSESRAGGSFLRADELRKLHAGLRQLLASGEPPASLAPFAPVLELSFSRIDDLGHFRMKADLDPLLFADSENRSQHSYTFTIDQTDIRTLIRQIERVLMEFPVRGG